MSQKVVCRNLNEYLEDFVLDRDYACILYLKKHRGVGGNKLMGKSSKNTGLIKSLLRRFVISRARLISIRGQI